MIQVRQEYKKKFQRVWIVQDRQHWTEPVLAADDLVLTFDFGLVCDVRAKGVQAGFLDHIVDGQVMDRWNYDVYDFFAHWHLDAQGEDIFSYQGIPFGDTFSQDVWNDITYFSRMAISFAAIQGMQATSIHYRLTEPVARSIAQRCNFIEDKTENLTKKASVYCFPVFDWMNMMVRPSGHKAQLKKYLRQCHGCVMGMFQGVMEKYSSIPVAYIQAYFPTIPIVDLADQEKSLRIYLEGYAKGWVKQLMHGSLPIPNVNDQHRQMAKEFLKAYDQRRTAKLCVGTEDISEQMHQLIRERIEERLPEYVATMEALVNHFNHRRLDVVVLIANLGMKANMLLAIARQKKIPSFLIVNGHLSGEYLFEGRNADWINAYSPSIKEHYYKNASNVFCLGDPRMDDYVAQSKRQKIKPRVRPHVVIGAGGYDSINMNGYLGEEFDFMAGVLEACQRSKAQGYDFDMTIKVRKNGYLAQYQAFCKEFYSDLAINLVDQVPMVDVLMQADLYLSIYSQTHIEAALLGIPSIYYKNNDRVIDPPFDGHCELLTAFNVDELSGLMKKFFSGEPIGREFMQREVLEKYWGPLDGKNTRRNLAYILELAEGHVKTR